LLCFCLDQDHWLSYSDVALFTISFPERCVSHRATGLGAYLTGPPVDGVKFTSTPALLPCTFCSDRLKVLL